jgi:ketosteroid isomerase-like protein
MPLSANAKLVTHIFEEVAKGNTQPWAEALHDDAIYRTIGTGSWSGTVTGKDNIFNEIFRPLSRRLGSRQTIATRVIDGGDIIVVQARGKNLTRTGVAYDNDYCFVISFKDGKMFSYEEYCDTELIANVLGDRMAVWKPVEKAS